MSDEQPRPVRAMTDEERRFVEEWLTWTDEEQDALIGPDKDNILEVRVYGKSPRPHTSARRRRA